VASVDGYRPDKRYIVSDRLRSRDNALQIVNQVQAELLARKLSFAVPNSSEIPRLFILSQARNKQVDKRGPSAVGINNSPFSDVGNLSLVY
jgi:hypothetical protein